MDHECTKCHSTKLLWDISVQIWSHRPIAIPWAIDSSLGVCCTFRSEHIFSVLNSRSHLIKTIADNRHQLQSFSGLKCRLCSCRRAWPRLKKPGRSLCYLEKTFIKRSLLSSLARAAQRILEMVSAVTFALDGWHLLSLNADRRNEKVNVAVRTTATPRQRCYRCGPHQRTPRAEEDAVFIWRFKSLPLSCLFPAFYIPSFVIQQAESITGRGLPWFVSHFWEGKHSVVCSESAFQNTSHLTCAVSTSLTFIWLSINYTCLDTELPVSCVRI